MINVRKGVFETNSSSTHAIVIAKEGTEIFDQIDFRIGEFGWEHEIYATPEEKASYIYTLACNLYDRDVADEISDLLSPYGINCTFSLRPIFEEYSGGKMLDNGWVDHCTEGEDLANDLLSDSALLIDFLFNGESYVETGNDNEEYERPVGNRIPKGKYVEYYKGN